MTETQSAIRYDQGDDGIVMRTVGDSNRVQVNTSGPGAFGEGTEQVFQILADVSDHLRTNPSALTADLDRIDADLDKSLDRLFAFLKIKSISTDPAYKDECRTAAEFVARDLTGIDVDAEFHPT